VRIGLLIVGHVDDRATHVAGDYPELFADLLDGYGIELVRYDLDAGRFPDSVTECAGWICSPSRGSTYDDEPWIRDAEALLRDFVAREVPYVGICFGHQLLAQALGSEVRRAPDGWEVGVQEYELVAAPPWMQPRAEQVALIASHEDQVQTVPPGAQLLARSAGCPVAGLTVGERAWSIQPHPEFVPRLADHLLGLRVELIGADKVDAARASLAARPPDRTVVARWIAATFGATADAHA
jgi:GMP synthase-like glutamine amidotransferase